MTATFRMAELMGLASALAVASSLCACEVVTGSTDGYELQDAGSEACAEAGCSSAGLSLGCASAADCEGDSQVCCLAITSFTSAQAACGPAPCNGSFTIQLCKADAECAAGSKCTAQQCMVGSDSLALSACGIAPVCGAL